MSIENPQLNNTPEGLEEEAIKEFNKILKYLDLLLEDNSKQIDQIVNDSTGQSDEELGELSLNEDVIVARKEEMLRHIEHCKKHPEDIPKMLELARLQSSTYRDSLGRQIFGSEGPDILQ